MNTPFENGVIRQQDIRDRNIAQQRIAEAIRREALRTDVLVDHVVNTVSRDRTKLTTVEQLWDAIQHDTTLANIRVKADQNAADYPGFSGWLNGQRLNIETTGRMRLAAELNEALYQRRFANTVGFRPAFA